MSRATKILINGRYLDHPMTGVQRYAFEICRAIDRMVAKEDSTIDGLTFIVARPTDARVQFPFANIREVRFGHFTGHLWEQIDLPFFARSNLILNLCNLCPLLARNNLTVVHDANVWLIPENYSRTFRWVYRVLIPLGIRRSRVWTTVSQFSAAQLLNRQLANRPPAAIVGNGSDHVREWDGTKSRFADSELPRPYVFALGSRSPNKNNELIFSLAPRLKALGISIIVAGDAGTNIYKQQGAVEVDNVHELGRVSDVDLAYLYRNCLCFLFPSFYEGFGIPPIEAMAVGAPVVSSNSSSLPEILGDAALYCPPTDAFAWATGIEQLFRDGDLRSRFVALGKEQASKYTWPRTARAIVQLARTAIA
jgi:glycosyltransferase involved in cell wall biosynthesis